MSRGRQRRGYLLVEVLVASAITVMLGAVILSVFFTVWKGVAVLTARTRVTGTLRNTVEQLGRDVAQAGEAPTTCPPAFAVSAIRLLLTRPGTTDCLVYQCVGGACTLANPGTLQRLVVSSAGITTQTRILAAGVIALTFARLDLNATPATIERIDCWLGVRTTATAQQYPVQGKILTVFTLRN